LQHFDLVILGSGIAGLSTAFSAVPFVSSIAVINKGKPTSAFPGGLINYATGRKANPVWRAIETFPQAIETLTDIEYETKTSFLHQNGVFRPALTQDMRQFFIETLQRDEWPDETWIEWIDDSNDIDYPYPLEFGGLWLPKGCTIDGEQLIKSYTQFLSTHEKISFFQIDEEPKVDPQNHTLNFDQKKFSFDKMVIASGSDVPSFMDFDWHRVHPVKGQLIEFETPSPIQHSYSLSALGYVAVLGKQRAVMGSTYEHQFDDLSLTEKATTTLKEKLNRITGNSLPFKVTQQWSGVRGSAPNRLPIVGVFHEYPDIYMNMSYGSKAYIYSRYCSELLMEEIFEGKVVPEDIHVRRFNRFRDDES
jgi:glycine/D-amino acid oxidase-like deaminating enzyme